MSSCVQVGWPFATARLRQVVFASYKRRVRFSHVFWKDHDNVAFVKCSVPEASSALLASQFVRNTNICLLRTVMYKYQVSD